MSQNQKFETRIRDTFDEAFAAADPRRLDYMDQAWAAFQHGLKRNELQVVSLSHVVLNPEDAYKLLRLAKGQIEDVNGPVRMEVRVGILKKLHDAIGRASYKLGFDAKVNQPL